MKILRAGLAIILIIYSVPALLSGLDIYHGNEPDLSSEWIIMCVFFVMCIVLVLLNILELFKIKNQITTSTDK